MATIKLPYVRYVRQVSNGTSRSKYSFLAMMRDNAASLEAASWAEAKSIQPTLTVNQLTRTDGVVDEEGEYTTVPTYTAYLDDKYDCYCQAGDAVSRMASMCGYAGIVAYRFTLPTVNPGALDELSLRIQRDRYLRSGVRVVVALSNSEKPSDDWGVIRGTANGSIVSPSQQGEEEGGVSSYGFLGQADVAYLLAGRAMEGTISFKAEDFPPLEDAANYTYLYVYMSPEDLCGSWQWYSEKDPRAYYIEGSAMLVPSDSAFTFATAAEPPAPTRTYELVKNGVVPSFEATETLSPILQVTVQKNGDPIDYNTIKQLAATVVGNGGHVNGTKLDFPSVTNVRQYAIIYGYGFKGTWPDMPGLVVYDVVNSQMLYTDVAIGLDASMSQLLKDGVYGVLDVIYNQGLLCPLFYQIGHTDPTPVLDGTLCVMGTESISCALFSVSDGVITTSASSVGYRDPTIPLGRNFSACASWSSDRNVNVSANYMAFTYDGKIYNTMYDHNYPYSNIPIPYVGNIRGIVPVDWDGRLSENDRVQWKVFVYGDLTSVGEVPCSRCAIVSMKRPNGTASQENPYTYGIEIPDIDSDGNWPTMGDDWSVQPQCDTVYNETRIVADLESFIVAGSADHKTRRWVTGVWYQTQYDDMIVGGRELPQTGVIGNAEGYGGFFPATVSSESASIPLEDGAAGLRALYGRFKAFGLTAVPNVKEQIGAAFSVNWKECQLKSSGVKIGSWQIAASALVVPFSCPSWSASQIEFDWTSWMGARTAGTKFHVWLMRNSYNLAPESIVAYDIWDNGTAKGVEYVGEIDPTLVTSTATLNLSRPLTGGYATLIVTAFVSMDEVNPSESPSFPQGASTLEVNMADGSVVNGDTAFLPDITLL